MHQMRTKEFGTLNLTTPFIFTVYAAQFANCTAYREMQIPAPFTTWTQLWLHECRKALDENENKCSLIDYASDYVIFELFEMYSRHYGLGNCVYGQCRLCSNTSEVIYALLNSQDINEEAHIIDEFEKIFTKRLGVYINFYELRRGFSKNRPASKGPWYTFSVEIFWVYH